MLWEVWLTLHGKQGWGMQGEVHARNTPVFPPKIQLKTLASTLWAKEERTLRLNKLNSSQPPHQVIETPYWSKPEWKSWLLCIGLFWAPICNQSMACKQKAHGLTNTRPLWLVRVLATVQNCWCLTFLQKSQNMIQFPAVSVWLSAFKSHCSLLNKVLKGWTVQPANTSLHKERTNREYSLLTKGRVNKIPVATLNHFKSLLGTCVFPFLHVSVVHFNKVIMCHLDFEVTVRQFLNQVIDSMVSGLLNNHPWISHNVMYHISLFIHLYSLWSICLSVKRELRQMSCCWFDLTTWQLDRADPG